MDDILWNQPILIAVICGLSWLSLAVLTVLFFMSATIATPKPKGLASLPSWIINDIEEE